LPVLGYKEKTLDVPLSLTDSVLGGTVNELLTKKDNRNNS